MLTSSAQTTGRKSNESASLKTDGTRILICAPHEKAGKNIAILDDKFTILNEFPGEDHLAFIRTAIALPSFESFIVLSDDGKGNAQLCMTDASGKTLKKTPFISCFQFDALVPSLTQASLTNDGKYLALTHATTNSPSISMMRIFDVENLKEISSRPLVAKVSAPQSFVLSTASSGLWSSTIKKVYYWALNSNSTDAGRGISSQLEFYRLDSTMELIPAKVPGSVEWKLQRIVEKGSSSSMRFMVNVVENKAVFASSMLTTTGKEQISIFEYVPSADCKEGNITNLMTEEHDPEMVRLVISPDGKYLFYSQKLADNHSIFAWSILKIQREANKVKLVPLTLTKLSKGVATTVAFSTDCKTLLVGCSTLSLFKLNLA